MACKHSRTTLDLAEKSLWKGQQFVETLNGPL